MKLIGYIACVLGAFVVPLHAQVVETITDKPSVIGKAYDIDSGILVYTEEHVYPSLNEHQVTYKEADGRVFANKTLDYTTGWLTPSFNQLNLRLGEAIEVNASQKGRLITRYQSNADAKMVEVDVERSEPQVVDAGFTHFIHKAWDNIVSGERVTMSYLAPSRQTQVDFRVKQIDCKIDTQVCFKVSANTWFFRLLLSPIYLTYDASTRDLLTFKGMSNIADKRGDYHNVEIRYEYPAEEVAHVANPMRLERASF